MAGGKFDLGPVTMQAVSAVVAGRRVHFSSTAGQIEHAGLTNTAIGFALDSKDAGDDVAVELMPECGVVEVVAAGSFSAGVLLYPAADGKVDDVKGGGGDRYYALEAATADGDIVQAFKLPAEKVASLLAYSSVAASSNVTSTATETDFDVKATIDGTALKAGDVIEVMALVKFPSTNSTNTAIIKLIVGTETIIATGATDVANDDICLIHAFITVVDAGSGGHLQAMGMVTTVSAATSVAAPVAFRKASAAEDLSDPTLDVKLSCTWSASSASNQANLDQLVVKIHKS